MVGHSDSATLHFTCTSDIAAKRASMWRKHVCAFLLQLFWIQRTTWKKSFVFMWCHCRSLSVMKHRHQEYIMPPLSRMPIISDPFQSTGSSNSGLLSAKNALFFFSVRLSHINLSNWNGLKLTKVLLFFSTNFNLFFSLFLYGKEANHQEGDNFFLQGNKAKNLPFFFLAKGTFATSFYYGGKRV